MDASTSTKQDAVNHVYNFFIQIDGMKYPKPINHTNVRKYTKLPDFDFDSIATWPANSYSLKPRLRRIIALDDDDDDELLRTSRSYKYQVPPTKMLHSKSQPKRVMVTISEENENDLHPKFAKDRKQSNVRTIPRAVGPDSKNKQSPNKPPNNSTKLSNPPNPPKFSREFRSAKTSSAYYNKKEVSVTHQNNRGKPPLSTSPSAEKGITENVKEKETLRSSRNLNVASKTVSGKSLGIPSLGIPKLNQKEKSKKEIQNLVNNNVKNNSSAPRRSGEKLEPNKLPLLQKKLSLEISKDNKNKQLTIHIPLEKNTNKKERQLSLGPPVEPAKHTVDCASETFGVVQQKDAEAVTDPLPTSVSQLTDMQDFEINAITTCESGIQTDSIKELFDSLEIPNVTLTKDKSESKEDSIISNPTPLPNLQVPPVKIVPQTVKVSTSDKRIYQNASYIISQATVTYTTRQKFNFQLVGNSDDVGPSLPPSPLDYPMNVVSVFKNEIKNKKTKEKVSSGDSHKNKNTPREDDLNHLNDLKSLDCSYVYNKLMKPSDIISTIRVNNGLLQSEVCEQFQRELNFIDSFFESLQYLETFSLTDKCNSENKVENFTNNSVLFDSFDIKNSEYDNFLSKLENGANIDDTETMASKSLCLLNLLIRDEQRRAKNLLFVLKMREDALKDFTKSQILWLENKKKHDNTDISTLKKKQRGALLKLQHECGEMQRMRKALLTLSEKRKVALMKTKKNIELKLKNNVDVEQIILGKKKLKRSTCFDRNSTPLKCFDLSSSGCDDSSTAKASPDAAETSVPQADVSEVGEVSEVAIVTSAEKCVQTSSAYCVVDHAADTAAENFVGVDGGYLNILFHNLTLPQIFSCGKQYEVNEEALKNIVNSANNQNTNLISTEVIEKLLDQIKNKDCDTSSTSPSTARSLIDEFDQYYKDLNEADKSLISSPEEESGNSSQICEIKESSAQTGELEYDRTVERLSKTPSIMTITADTSNFNNSFSNNDEPCACEAAAPLESEESIDSEPVTTSQAPNGPLPVPVGAVAVVDSQPPDVPTGLPPKSSSSSFSASDSVSSQLLSVSMSSMTSTTPSAHFEAEELRRQQLAIEREIKALEQQQCRLLVLREIPDKPPPPYTPPTETRTPKPPRMFTPDENLEEKVIKHIIDPKGSFSESTEAFSVFVQDFCQESLERHKQEQSDMPWDACNLLPQKPKLEINELALQTSSELKDVLTSVTSTAVSGVSSRRSDHIDEILFTEWRRCEPEWTALHADEAIVKNQVFESIFQKILTETIDEYKKTVLCKVVMTD